MIRELGLRRYIAWKLVQLAHRLYDAEHFERIVITDEHGQVGEFVIAADEYGSGVWSYSGAQYEASPLRARFGCCDVVWEHDYRPDWLDE